MAHQRTKKVFLGGLSPDTVREEIQDVLEQYGKVCTLHTRNLVSCASLQETVWLTKSNFLGLLPKRGNDQWDCKLGNYYVALPYNSKVCLFVFEHF